MTQKRMSQYDPFINSIKGSFDIDSDGNVYIKAKKLCLNSTCTAYLTSADGTTFDFYVGSTKEGEISKAGFRNIK